MSITAYDRTPSRSWKYFTFNFNTFKSSEDFLKEVIDINESKDKDFKVRTGYYNFFRLKKYQEITEYSRISRLNKTLEEFDELYDQIDMGGSFNKQKLLITDDKRGIFSFSLASKGLYRGVEYYSEEILWMAYALQL